jgi:hypothetical protein
MTSVGILGGGQLARMLALSGAPLGLRFLVLDTVSDACAAQYVRDYLETLDWKKTPPGPRLPPEVIEKTAAKYREALERLTGGKLAG